MPKRTKKNAQDKIKDRIIQLVEEADDLFWERQWISLKDRHPRNAISGRHYSSLNFLMLGMIAEINNYDDPRWLTFNQAKKAGGSVKRGEKGSMITWYSRTTKTVEDSNTGEEEEKQYFYMRVHMVFNVKQTEGCELPELEYEASFENHDPIEAAQMVADEMPNPPTVVLSMNGPGYYRPNDDLVSVPKLEVCKTAESHYKTLFHELVHSTGHEDRLDRELSMGSEMYAKEELVAEIAAAMLCGHVGIDIERIERQSAAYVQGWMKQIKETPELLIRAASQSQRAVNYILGAA